MTRAETTEFLTATLVRDKLSDRKYFAREVTLDYGTRHPKRVDVMQFSPAGVTYPSDNEKGVFVCYEVKSCIEDVYSGHVLNFFGEKNYIVTTMKTWKRLQEDLRSDKFTDFLKNVHPGSSSYFGVMALVAGSVALNDTQALFEEFLHPTPLSCNKDWHFSTPMPCRQGPRRRSMNELLFAMLRAKHSETNAEDIVCHFFTG